MDMYEYNTHDASVYNETDLMCMW